MQKWRRYRNATQQRQPVRCPTWNGHGRLVALPGGGLGVLGEAQSVGAGVGVPLPHGLHLWGARLVVPGGEGGGEGKEETRRW